MNQMKKKKLCWNCEGSVDKEAENCLFCGVYLHPEEIKNKKKEVDDEDFTPIYQEEEISDEPSSSSSPLKEEPSIENLLSKTYSSTLLPTLFLLSGSFFFLFGLILYLFSKDGVFSLQWNGNFWFLYLFISLPLLFMGWRALSSFEERDH